MPLIRFANNLIKVEGEIELFVIAGQQPQQSIMRLNFLIVWIPLANDVILGWLGLNALQAIILTYHLLVCFLMRNETGEMKGDQ